MIGYPFDSKLTYEDDGTPVYDRAINSAQLRKLYKTMYSDGVPRTATLDGQLKVVESSGMEVKVNAGFSITNGLLKWFDEPTILTVSPSEDQPRIDSIVIRMDDTIDVRACELFVKKGTKSNTPVRPELTRTDTIYEIGIADIYVNANSYVISQSNITDTRGETVRCGFISTLGLEGLDDGIKYPVDGSGHKITAPRGAGLLADGNGGVMWVDDSLKTKTVTVSIYDSAGTFSQNYTAYYDATHIYIPNMAMFQGGSSYTTTTGYFDITNIDTTYIKSIVVILSTLGARGLSSYYTVSGVSKITNGLRVNISTNRNLGLMGSIIFGGNIA